MKRAVIARLILLVMVGIPVVTFIQIQQKHWQEVKKERLEREAKELARLQYQIAKNNPVIIKIGE